MPKIKTSICDGRWDALTTAAGSTAFIDVYSGSPPAKSTGAFTSATGTHLAHLACANPIASGAASGVLTFSAITSSTGLAAGTPGYFRVNTDGSTTDGTTTVVQGTAGVSSGELSFDDDIASGGAVGITSLTITDGSA